MAKQKAQDKVIERSPHILKKSQSVEQKNEQIGLLNPPKGS